MRRILAIILLALCAMSLWAKKEEEPIESLKQRAEAAEGSKQIELLVKVAQRQMQAADQLFDQGTTDQAQAAVQDVLTYSLRAIQQAKDTRKRMKHTEIDIRKLTDHMNDMKRSLSVDDRPPVAAAIEKIDKARSDLLTAMFKR